MSAIIETRNLVKRYGKLEAVSSLNLEVPEGAIYGFVGPNGAGKTSTMRILTTLMQPTSGEAYVAGFEVTKDPRNVRRAIGYMPDFFGVYDDMRVWEYLDFFAACYDIPERERAALVDDLLELVELSHRKNDLVDKLSRGMKQRLCLARALAHDPRCCSWTSPPPAWTRAPASRCGSCWWSSPAWARPSSSPRTSWRTWPKSARASGSSRPGRWWPRAAWTTCSAS